MRLPKLDENTIDVEQTKQMVDMFLDAGFTYFDTAWAYAGSEDAIRQVLVERYPRELYQLATKNAVPVSSTSSICGTGYRRKRKKDSSNTLVSPSIPPRKSWKPS